MDGVPDQALDHAAPTAADGRAGRLLALLRAETGAAHAALDARLQPAGTLSHAAYAALLRATSRIVLPLELPLAVRLGASFIKRAAGERRQRLERDLRLLGHAVAEPWPALPVLESQAAAVGAGYVLIGSHLGGEVIARHLYGRDPGPDSPTSYVRLYSPDTGARWITFLGTLENFGRATDDEAHRRAAAAALALFTAFGLALDGEGVSR